MYAVMFLVIRVLIIFASIIFASIIFASIIAVYLTAEVATHYDGFSFYKGVDCIMAQLRLTNAFMESRKPWKLRDEPNLLSLVLHTVMENLRVCGILLQVRKTPISSSHYVEYRFFSRKYSVCASPLPLLGCNLST